MAQRRQIFCPARKNYAVGVGTCRRFSYRLLQTAAIHFLSAIRATPAALKSIRRGILGSYAVKSQNEARVRRLKRCIKHRTLGKGPPLLAAADLCRTQADRDYLISPAGGGTSSCGKQPSCADAVRLCLKDWQGDI